MSATQYDGNMLHQFLTNTPESALRKMLVGPKFQDANFNMLIKILRAGNEEQFCKHFHDGTYPKAKFNAGEIVLKETFWNTCINALNTQGLLSPASPQKIAA